MNTTTKNLRAEYTQQIAAANAMAEQARQMGLPQIIVQGHLDRAAELFTASLQVTQ